MYCLTVGEQYHPQVSVLHFLNRRPPPQAPILLDLLLHGIVDYSFDPFIPNHGTISALPNELEILGELHWCLSSLSLTTELAPAGGHNSLPGAFSEERFVARHSDTSYGSTAQTDDLSGLPPSNDFQISGSARPPSSPYIRCDSSAVLGTSVGSHRRQARDEMTESAALLVHHLHRFREAVELLLQWIDYGDSVHEGSPPHSKLHFMRIIPPRAAWNNAARLYGAGGSDNLSSVRQRSRRSLAWRSDTFCGFAAQAGKLSRPAAPLHGRWWVRAVMGHSRVALS
jgi:hypothetical protein